MPFFMENLLNQVEMIRAQGTLFLANTADRPLATVATRDIAATAAVLLADDSWSGQESVPVVGDALSPDDMARVLSEVLERPVGFQQVDERTYKETMTRYGMHPAWAQGLADMAAAQNDGIYDAEQKASASAAPTDFRRWCQEVLRPNLLDLNHS
ncbi:hypothetical protein ACFYNY_35980 [Streptomyces sp. NPDC006530]|uniref:NmrA family NAD(P)-binding protein n=1 Tax=Streptomyces sp. NPDC006530 TaxID=3364750 RepID=UPI0036B246E5